MTDAELEKYLGIEGHPKAAVLIASLAPEKRELYDRMAGLETEVSLWQEGLGPKPESVLIDTERSTARRKWWR